MLFLTIFAIFVGIAMAMAALYSSAQLFMARGRLRRAHAASLATLMAVMAALAWPSEPAARLAAAPMLAAAFWTFLLEERWYRIFPALQQLFAAVVLAGLAEL